jgi:hypothetical protein
MHGSDCATHTPAILVVSRIDRAAASLGLPKMASRDEIRREMQSNAEALKATRAALVRKHPNTFVLMHDRKVRGIFPSLEEAEAAGQAQYPNLLFSLHELTTHPRRVGSLTRA